uniref:CRAL-TRIO domain-containing protein n=1 Tax=Davidia involucrata TaxID=16924 RepID=A0A5B7B8M8_DAVIN
MNSSSSSILSQLEQEQLIEKLQLFKIQGRDKRGRNILRIIGKLFPARLVSVEALNKYLEEKIFPRFGEGAFSVVYVHTGVQRCDNFPGISALRSLYEAIPINVKDHLETVYFLHPRLQSRLFLATFGRLLFSGGLYWKVKYVNRLEFLWEHMRRNEMEIPDFVFDHEEELEDRPIPMLDYYGLESDHPRDYCASLVVDSPLSTYSMRCIS